MRVTFLDGSRATLKYPPELRSIEDSVSFSTSGSERGTVGVRPQVSYRGVHYRIEGEPLECLETRDGSVSGIWQRRDDRVLVLRYGDWYVSVFDTYADLEAWARHVRGRVTGDGWLILEGDHRVQIGPEQQYGDTGIMLGGLDPGVLIWPLHCIRKQDTAAEVASGVRIDGIGGKEAFASWCDREASMEVHVYASGEFIKQVARRLRIEDVVLEHPLRRYHIVP